MVRKLNLSQMQLFWVMVRFIHFRRLLEVVMVIQVVAAKVLQKHDVAHDESDLIGAWLKLIIQYHRWKKPEQSGTEEHLTRVLSKYYNPPCS